MGPTIRRAVVFVLVTACVVTSGPLAAHAGAHRVEVDVAAVVVAAAWDTPSCDVRVLRHTGDVNLVCAEAGAAAIMLRIPLPGAQTIEAIRSIRLDDSGSSDNCADETPPRPRVRNGMLRLILSRSYDDVGSFDCWYHSVRVRYLAGA